MLFAKKIYMYGKLYVQNDPIKCENSEEFQVEFVSEYLILLRLVEILRLIKFKLIFFLKISSKKILFHKETRGKEMDSSITLARRCTANRSSGEK